MKNITAIGIGALMMSWAWNASATTYSFEDMIDKWGLLRFDAQYISENRPLSYTHDITDSVDFTSGDQVIAAWLELDFTNDLTDSVGSIITGLIRWDFTESVQLAFDGANWGSLGEVGKGQYVTILNVDWLNDNGELDVTITVSNDLGTATAWLDHSRLYGIAETVPVPEPTSILLFTTGMAGLVGLARRKKYY